MKIDIDDMEALFDRRFALNSLCFLKEVTVLRKMLPEEFYDELTALVPIVWLPCKSPFACNRGRGRDAIQGQIPWNR